MLRRRCPTPGPLAPFLLTLMILPTLLPAQQTPLALDRWNLAARDWIELLRAGDFQGAGSRVDPAVPPEAMGPEQLRTIWSQLTAQLGGLNRLDPGSVTPYQSYQIVDLPAAFEKQGVILRVVLSDSLLVSGFFVRPPEPPAYDAPAYVDPGSFGEVEVTVGAEPWALPAVLTLPKEGAALPGVVLVHGSGPNDRDETLGGNRPFRDLAWGLASRGIVVLRYDKRTRVHGAALPRDIGLEAEVVEDALAALTLLRTRPEVDPERVFLLGHSLGAMLAPGIALRDGKVAGVVVMAAPLRPFLAVIRSQLEHVAGLQRASDPEGAALVDSLLLDLDRLEGGGMAGEESLLGAPPAYWREVVGVDPLGAARRLQAPLLVLQGGRDYQSTPEDLELWKTGLQGREGAITRLYPSLSHLFTPGEGMATPEEYSTTVRHVDPAVIEDLARWIRGEGLGAP